MAKDKKCEVMGSETQGEIPPSLPPKPKRRRLLAAIIVIVVVVVVAAASFAFLFRPTQTPSGPAWLFKGAYAKYTGNLTVSLETMTMTLRYDVVDFNSTHAKLLAYVKAESSSMGPIESQDTIWVDLREGEYNYEVEGGNLLRSYEDSIYIQGVGTRNCTVYEYQKGGITMTLYIDKEIGWPLKLKVSSIDFNYDVNLAETNIPELEK